MVIDICVQLSQREKKKMKIAYFVTNLDFVGGVERFVTTWANYWVNKGINVSIISIYNGENPYYQLDKRVSVKSLQVDYNPKVNQNKLLLLRFYIIAFRRLYKLTKKEKYDVLIGQWVDTTVIISIVGKILGIPTVGFEHTNYKRLNTFFELSRKLFYKFLTRFVCLVPSEIEKYNYLNCKTISVSNPLSFRSERKSDLSQKKILSVGRLSKEKGFDLLIKSYKNIAFKHKDWSLTIVGEDFGEKNNLLELIEELGLSQVVTIKPFVNDIKSEYQNSSLYVLPSRHEGFGNVILEAMESGLPVISFDCPTGPRNIIDNNIDGLLVEDGNTNSLSFTLGKLMVNKEQQLALQQNGYKKVKRYYIEEISKQWMDIFKELKVNNA